MTIATGWQYFLDRHLSGVRLPSLTALELFGGFRTFPQVAVFEHAMVPPCRPQPRLRITGTPVATALACAFASTPETAYGCKFAPVC